MKKLFNKKAITPVVAIALLLVVSVVAVVGFQTWFGTYSSGIFTNTEKKSSTGIMSSGINAYINQMLYFKNGYDNLTINKIKIDGYVCNISSNNYSSGMLQIYLGNCSDYTTTSTPEIVVLTDKGIFSKKVYLKGGVASLSSGIIIDSPIKGLTYKTNTNVNGLTLSNGGFKYHSGDSISFYIGNKLLGTTIAKPIITPLDFFGTSNLSDRRVVNLAKFLQSIDNDANLDNGIDIVNVSSLNLNGTFNFDMDNVTFNSTYYGLLENITNLTIAGNRSFIKDNDAKFHLNNSLFLLNHKTSIVNEVDPFGDGSGVALYQFEGNANDVGGRYNGTWSGTENYSSDKFGQAGNFDGNSEIVSSKKFNYTSFSISFFVNFNDVPTTTNWDADYQGIVNMNNALGNSDYSIAVRLDGSRIAFILESIGGGIADILYLNSGIIKAHNLYHITTTFDYNTKQGYIYVNGIQKATKIFDTTNWYLPNSLIHIGGRGDGKANIHNGGLIDQVRIFNRSLTPQEVQMIYNERK